MYELVRLRKTLRKLSDWAKFAFTFKVIHRIRREKL